MQFGPIRLDEEAKFVGLWWIDGPDATPSPGELTYDPNDGLRLRVICGKESFEKRLRRRYEHRDWNVRGLCGGGDQLVILRSWFITHDRRGELVYSVNSALVGDRSYEAELTDPLMVRSIAFRIPHLEKWLKWPDFTPLWEMSTQKPASIEMLSDGYDTMDKASGALPENGASVWFNATTTVSGLECGMRITGVSAIELHFEQPTALDAANHLSLRTALLLNLLIGTHCPFEWRMVRTGRGEWYELGHRVTRIPAGEIVDARCKASELNFAPLLDRWITISKEVGPAIDRLQSLMWKWARMLDDELGTAAESLEGIGRQWHNSAYLSDDDFSQLVSRLDAVIAGCSDDLRARAEGAFRHLNTPSLVTLICRLLADLPNKVVAGIIGCSVDEVTPSALKKFARKAAEARNAQSHGRRSERAADAQSFWRIIDEMRLLIIASVLQRSGLPDALLEREYSNPHAGWRWG